MTTKSLAFEVRMNTAQAQAIELVTAALKAEGFGVLTRIDVHTTLKEKIGAEFRAYTILGACNPPLAHKVLSHNAEVGLLLPCNVTVEADGAGALVRIGNPEVLLSVGGMETDDVLRSVAGDVSARLTRVAEALRALPEAA